MAKGFVDYLRMALGWLANTPLVPIDFVCIDDAHMSSPYSVSRLATAATDATLQTCDSAAVLRAAATSAVQRLSYSTAYQRPC